MEQKLVKETFFKFFTTALASSVTLSVLSMTDLMIAGNVVGEKGLAAVSLALPVVILVQIASALWGTGGAIVFSARLGEGDLRACGRILTLSLAGALASGLLLGAGGLFFLRPLVSLLGAADGEEFYLASQYVGVLLAGMPVMILSPVMITYLRNDSREGYSMACVVICSLLNIVLSLFAGIVLKLGILGIGGATVVSQLVCCVLAGGKLLQQSRLYGLARDAFSLRLMGEIFKPGSTVALIFFCQMLLTVVVNRTLNAEGGAAVYAVIKYLINFLFALFDGVTGAMQPMLGIYYGEREQQNVRATARYAFCTMAVLALLMFLLLELGGPLLCGIFGVETPRMQEMTIAASRIIGVYCFGAAAVTFLNAFYRCVGRERISFLLGLFDNLLFPLAGIFLYVQLLSMGTMGVFLGIGSSAFFTLLFWALLCRPWKHGILLLRKEQFSSQENEYHKIISATFQEAVQITESVEEYCEEHAISPKKQYYISLFIEELIINVVGLAEESRGHGRTAKTYYADIRIAPQADGSIWLRIRDNLTEWMPASMDIQDPSQLVQLDEDGSVNELGIGIIKRLSKSYSYKRTIGFNNFSAIL